MDGKAKAFCRYIYSTNLPPPSLYNDPNWGISINGIHLTESLDKALAAHIHKEALFNHLLERKHITEAGLSLVDWNILGKANTTLTRVRYLWVVKFVSGFLPTANHMHRQGSWDDNLCPLCKNEVENNKHLMRCTCSAATMERHSQIYEFHQWLLDNKTDPNIAQTITYTLINGPETSFVSMLPLGVSSLVKLAAQEQDIIGWDNFLFGRMSTIWSRAQQQYFDSITSNRNDHFGSGWLKRLIPRVYDMVHAVWMFRNSIVHEAVEE